MKIQPLADRVIIEPIEPETKTASGIIIPDTAKEKPQKGKVIAIGSDPLTVKEGDTVIYGKYSGTEITIEDKKYLIMRETDIYVIV